MNMEIPSPSKNVHEFKAELYFKCFVKAYPCTSSSQALRLARLSVGKELLESTRKVSIVEDIDLFKPPKPTSGILQFYIFDTNKYKVSGDKEVLAKTRQRLIRDLREASKVNGAEIISQRTELKSSKKEVNNGLLFYVSDLCCPRTNVRKHKVQDSTSTPHCFAAPNSKRKLFSQKFGNKGTKRLQSTKQPTCAEDKCKCAPLRLYSNKYCFFTQAPSEATYHTGHKIRMSHSELSISSSQLPAEIEQKRQIMSLATRSPSSQASGVRKVSGGTVTRTKQAMANAGIKDTTSLNDNKFTKKYLQSMDSAEELTSLLHEHECTVLTITNKKANVSMNVSNKKEASAKVACESLGDPNLIGDAARQWIEDEKSCLSSSESDLLCIAWCSPAMYKMARAFSQSLSIDGTHKTVTIDNMVHLTVTVKNSFGKTFVVLRFFIPNQQVWMFRYVLMVAIPNLLGKDICSQINIIVTDGDPQLCQIVDLAILQLYTSAKRRRCTWHVIDRGMDKYRSQIPLKKGVSKNFGLVFQRLLQRWLYTWYRPGGGITSMEEYEVSKAILFAVLDSDMVRKYYEPSAIATLKEYVIGVTNCDNHMLSFLFDSFDMEVYSNSAHEGTNKGLKYSAFAVSPQMKLGTSIYNMIQYDQQRYVEHRSEFILNVRKNALHAQHWNEVTTYCRKILMYLEMECEESVVACSFRSIDNTFLIVSPNDLYGNSNLIRRKFIKKCENLKRKSECLQEEEKLNGFEDKSSNPSTSINSNNNEKDRKDKGKGKGMSKKKLRRLTTSTLLESLLEEERNILRPDNKKGSSILVPEITSCFHVPCLHELFVYHHYLCQGKTKDGEPYIKEWNHRQVSPLYWNMYAYLMDKDELDEWTDRDVDMFRCLRELNPNSRIGTLIEVCSCESGMVETVPLNIDWNQIIDTSHDKCDENGLSADEWDGLPASERVTNYSKDDTKKWIDRMDSTDSVQYNSSKYEMKFSQGCENISQARNDLFGNGGKGVEVSESYPSFEERIDGSQDFEFSSSEQRKTQLMKLMQSTLNSVNLDDEVMFRMMLNQVNEMKKNTRSLNEMINGEESIPDDNLTRFPNSSYGRKSRDRISKQFK